METRVEKSVQKSEKVYENKYVCEKCGLIHVEQETADDNKADQWKLVALAVGGIVVLLALWFWVFKWGVPLVKHIQSIE